MTLVDPLLQDLVDAWDKTSGDGRDENLARTLADEWVDANPEWVAINGDRTVEQFCDAIGVYRDAGNKEEVWKIEAWLLHRYEPQQIGGSTEPQIRVVPEGG